MTLLLVKLCKVRVTAKQCSALASCVNMCTCKTNHSVSLNTLTYWHYVCVWHTVSTQVMYLQRCLVVTWLVPCETAVISARSVCTPQPCTMSHHFMQSHIRWVHACLAVTCHLHFWQNDCDLLPVTVVTWEWEGYWNKNQHRKLTPVKKFSCCSCRNLNPLPFNPKSSALTTELSPLPHGWQGSVCM